MNDYVMNLTKSHVQKRILFFEILGLILIILTCWITELFDPPFSFSQVIIESYAVIIVGFFVVYWTRKMMMRIKYLEGFIVICASCKQVRVNERWVSLESIILSKSDAQFSHSVCPKCARELYPDFVDEKGNVI